MDEEVGNFLDPPIYDNFFMHCCFCVKNAVCGKNICIIIPLNPVLKSDFFSDTPNHLLDHRPPLVRGRLHPRRHDRHEVHGQDVHVRLQGSILQNSISAENILDNTSASNFGLFPPKKKPIDANFSEH
jgi:hypothetical protein